MTIGACWVIGLLTLTVIGHYSNPGMSRVNINGPVMKAKAQANTSVGRGEHCLRLPAAPRAIASRARRD